MFTISICILNRKINIEWKKMKLNKMEIACHVESPHGTTRTGTATSSIERWLSYAFSLAKFRAYCKVHKCTPLVANNKRLFCFI